MKIGIIGGAFKPCTRGHWELIKRASRENDSVIIYASSSDRGDVSEGFVIKGNDMIEVWKRFLVPMLPPNAKIEFGGSPVRKIYELLGEANEVGSVDTFTVYSDPTDITARFGLDKQKKYFGDLLSHSQVMFVGVDRVGDLDVSGTQMRQLLKHGMKDAFISLLPEGVDGNGIWETLVIRSFVRDACKK